MKVFTKFPPSEISELGVVGVGWGGNQKRLTISGKKKTHRIQRASGSNMAAGFLTAVLEARI